jgi:hypothetical protein
MAVESGDILEGYLNAETFITITFRGSADQ